jgi:hypothetical protein
VPKLVLILDGSSSGGLSCWRLVASGIGLLVPALCLAQAGPPYLSNDPGVPGSKNWEINLAQAPTLSRNASQLQIPSIVVTDLDAGHHIRQALSIDAAAGPEPIAGDRRNRSRTLLQLFRALQRGADSLFESVVCAAGFGCGGTDSLVHKAGAIHPGQRDRCHGAAQYSRSQSRSPMTQVALAGRPRL